MADILSRIESLLSAAVSEGLREAAAEKEIQLSTAKEINKDKRNLTAKEGESDVDEAEDEDKKKVNTTGDSGGDMSKRPVITPEELPAAITVDMVINSIDAIRSARSLKKPEVREEFEEYFNGLSPDEKVGLLAFVNGIAETLIGDAPGGGLDPSEEPYNVRMDSSPDQSKDASAAVAPREDGEDSETPIVVGG